MQNLVEISEKAATGAKKLQLVTEVLQMDGKLL